MGDVTLPDGALVQPGAALTKTWRLRNTGNTTWGSGYQLVFRDREQMNAPAAVDVPSTAPGQEVNISVPITAPTSDGLHTGRWQLRNPQGTLFGPPVWVSVAVHTPASGSTAHIASFRADPASPASVGTVVRLYARATWWPQFRSMRFVIDGSSVEMPNVRTGGGNVEINYDWNTGGLSGGDHAIEVQIADQSDASWSHPERQGMIYTLSGSGGGTGSRPPDVLQVLQERRQEVTKMRIAPWVEVHYRTGKPRP